MGVTAEQLKERGLRKLKARRVSTGWWIGAYDSLPDFLPELLKPFHRLSAWQIFYGLFMSFFAGVSIALIFDVLYIWASYSRTAQDELTALDFSLLAMGGVATVCFHAFIALAHPASSSSMFLLNQYTKVHPEMAPIVAKWAAKRGFFTSLDIHKIEQACRIMDLDPNTATQWAPLGPVYRSWKMYQEKLKNKKAKCKSEREESLKNSGLMPYIEAASMDLKTIPASAPSTPMKRL